MDQGQDGPANSYTHCTSSSLQEDATEPKRRPYNDWKGKPLTPAEHIKVKDILAACEDPANLDTLTTAATSIGGYVDDEVRQVACTLSNHFLLNATS